MSWRFRSDLAGGGAMADIGYHIIDAARFLVGEVEDVAAVTARFVNERSAEGSEVTRGDEAGTATRHMAQVDVEDAGAAVVRFAGGQYGVLDASRVATGRLGFVTLEVYGSAGSAYWNMESIDDFNVCLADDPEVFGFRRVRVSTVHPGAKELLVAAAQGTGVGLLGQIAALWAEGIGAIAEGRRPSPNFEDGVRANAVLEALYLSAATGRRVPVEA